MPPGPGQLPVGPSLALFLQASAWLAEGWSKGGVQPLV
jgi:hypothetical protein